VAVDETSAEFLVGTLTAIVGPNGAGKTTYFNLLTPGFRLFDGDVVGAAINGKVLVYYMVFAPSALLFLLRLRVVNSRFGRVLEAIRENEFHAEAIGYRTLFYRLAANCLVAVLAACAGILMGLGCAMSVRRRR
jgi:branched-chain amino acid transport system permease protein